MTRAQRRVALATLLVAAAWLRLHGLDWDAGRHLHPDERFLTMVTTAIEAPASVGEYLDTARSPLNPSNRNFRFFVYGTLPLFVTRAVASALGLANYEQVPLVGRVLSALWDLGTVWLTFRIGLLLAGPALGLAAAALVATCVLAIQLSHFYTVDTAGTFFATAALLATLHVARAPRWRWHLAFGAAFGLALGCRINNATLVLPYALALAVAWHAGRARTATVAAGSLAAAAVAAGVFRLVHPYAFAGPGLFDLAPATDFAASLREIRAYVTGAADYPPGAQWIGRTPVLFAARNVLGWGLGLVWGVAVPAGVVWALRRWRRQGDEAAGIVALWAAGLFLWLSVQFAPSMRYFLPLVPAFALLAAWPLVGAGRRRVALVALVAATACWAIAFTAVYRRPHTRVEASRWLYANVPAGTTIASEHWDDALPLPLPGHAPARYRGVQLELYGDEDENKRAVLLERLAAADWIVISSNRLYRSIPRAPWRWPLARRYYELLFSGALGFDLERVFTSYPRLGPLEIPDDGAEEAFSVYDHPVVLVFRKSARYSPTEAAALLGAVPLTGLVRTSPREAGALYARHRPPDVPLPGAEAVRSAVAPGGVGSVGALLRWLIAFEVLWLACAVLLWPVLRMLPDAGTALAAVLGWLAPGWLAWLLTSLGVPVVTPAAARLVAAGFVAAALAAAWARRRALGDLRRVAGTSLAQAHAVFLVAFVAFAAVRALVPAIYWGEKPMDFAILNSILRARTLPPADPWFAGETLNYAYCGHAVVAFFTRLAAVPPAIAFNLGVATIGGLLAVAAFGAGRLLGGRALAGALAAGAVAGLGNLAGPRLLASGAGRALDFDYYWATSRVIERTINEYPFWNLLFADLHAHVMAQPLLVALLAAGAGAVRASEVRAPAAVALLALVAALLAGAVAVTSPWSLPTAVAAITGFALLVWRRAGGGVKRLPVALLGFALVLGGAWVLFLPFWTSHRAPGRVWGWETDRAPIAGVLTVFGIFLVAVLPPLVARALGQARDARGAVALAAGVLAVAVATVVRSPAAGLFAGVAVLGLLACWRAREAGTQAAALLVALAGAIGTATEVFYVWDRMNTVFKYYLDAWLLLGCAAPVLVLRDARRGVWQRAWLGTLAVAVAGGVVTSVTGAVAFVRSPHARSDVPTLDGMAYLRHLRPAELAAYEWLNREVRGVPVILEAQGPSYQEFGRVSMNTGLPAALGWEYHLFQQGRSREQIERRRADLRELFSTTDQRRAAKLLARYHVDLVFVGALERETYPRAGLAKFAEWELTPAAFQNREVTIYATPGLLARVHTMVDHVEDAVDPPPAGRLREPRDLARAPDGTLVVADFGHRRLQRFAADGTPVADLGAEGSGPGEFRDPCGVAVAPDGRLFVADTWNHRVQVLAADGEPLATWRADLFGPRGVALGRDGSVWVTDTGHRRVVRLAADGRVLGAWGDDVLAGPIGIAVDGSGRVLVADAPNDRIVVFSPEGIVLAAWPVPWRDGARMEPYLEVGPDGVVWVTDPVADRVLLFDGDGRPLGTAVADAPLHLPLGIAVLDTRTAAVTSAADDAIVRVRRAAE